jgi:[ribosomal protein S18]-alanine N-acetyltransferase
LLRGLIERAQQDGCSRMMLEVRAANAAASALYTAHGFRVTGRRAKFYERPPDDAVLMEKDL